MANSGYDFNQDITLTPGASCQTTTSQYRFVCGSPESATSFRPNIPASTTAALVPFGIVQNRMTGNSAEMVVRPLGISKVYCLDTITAFNYVRVDGSTGSIMPIVLTAYIASTNLTVNVGTLRCIGGQALESGVTGQAIEMIIRPFLAAYGAM